MTRFLLTLVLALAPSGCGILGIGSEERTLEVAPYKGACVGLFHTLCLQVREPGTTDFLNMFETPRDFDFEWGFNYVIVVEEREIENPPADGSSIERTLERILVRTPVAVGTEFDLLVVTEPGLVPLQAGRWELYHGPEVVFCEPAAACDGLDDAIATHPRIRVRLRFPAVPTREFAIVGWSPCAEEFGPCVDPS